MTTATSECLDEDTVLALVEGRLRAAAVEVAERHIHGCAACADLVTSAATLVPSQPAGPEPKPLATLASGTTFGRYTILSLLGRGGMGEVHAAYDPRLDRRVALKVLHGGPGGAGPDGDTGGRARLLREAKAIARLSHPNVVAVHDAGEIDQHVFIAMEYVEGQTLDVWSRAAAGGKAGRTWPEVLVTFALAGRGLAAAHEAGIVHRDFKPQNVMVGGDGRVRVMDFGLATEPLSEAAGPAVAAGWSEADAAGARLEALTRTGMLLGTPVYMAPEQFRGEPADERSDQFSFCVALYECLYGERPFPSGSFAELATAVLAGRVRERPARTAVPSWLRAVVLRGLSPRREDRFPSMPALLAALEGDPARRRRRIAAAALLAALALTAAGIVSSARGRSAEACHRGAKRLETVWELPGARFAPRHDALKRAFSADRRSFFGHALGVVMPALDSYAAHWSEAHADACDATHARGEQSSQVLALRQGCLDEALGAFRALTDLLVDADALLVTAAPTAVRSLPDLERCRDGERLRSTVRLPQDAAERQRVEQLRGRLAELKIFKSAGRATANLPKAAQVVADARAIGFKPALAEAIVSDGWLRLDTEPEAVEKLATEGFWLALRVGEDEVAERAAHLVHTATGLFQARYAESRTWGTMTEALLTRLGAGHDLEWGWYWQDEAGVLMKQGKLDEARVVFQKGLDIKEKLLGREHPDLAGSMCGLAAVYLEQPDFAGALRLADEGITRQTKSLGPDHPQLSICLQNRGEALSGLGRFAEALQSHQRARAIWTEDVGLENRLTAYAINGIGVAQLGLGDAAGARKTLEEALAIREKTESDPVALAETRFALARALRELGEDERAAKLARSARVAYADLPALAARLRVVDRWLASGKR